MRAVNRQANPFQVHDHFGQLYVEEFKCFQHVQKAAGTPLLQVVVNNVYDKGNSDAYDAHYSGIILSDFFRSGSGSSRFNLQSQALNNLITTLSTRGLLAVLLTKEQVQSVGNAIWSLFKLSDENSHPKGRAYWYDNARLLEVVDSVVTAITDSLGPEATRLPNDPGIITLAKFQAPALTRLKQVHQQERVRLSFWNRFGRRKDSPLNAPDLATAVTRIRERVVGDDNSVGVEEAAQSASRQTVSQFS